MSSAQDKPGYDLYSQWTKWGDDGGSLWAHFLAAIQQQPHMEKLKDLVFQAQDHQVVYNNMKKRREIEKMLLE